MFNGLDDFTSKRVACFYTNAQLHILVMSHCTKLHISPRDPLMPKSNAELAQLIRRTFDFIPAEHCYSEDTMAGVILVAIPDSTVDALEAAACRANGPLETYETVLRHLEAVDIEHNGGNKRPSPADPKTDPPNKYIRPTYRRWPSSSSGHCPLPAPPPPFIPHLVPTAPTAPFGYDCYKGPYDTYQGPHSIMKRPVTSTADKEAWR
eukprot:jgi/Tetstr1/464625/TSEL_009379.t1